MMALGLELKRRGHQVIVGTAEYCQKKLEEAELMFSPVRPHMSPDDPEAINYFMDQRMYRHSQSASKQDEKTGLTEKAERE